MKHGETTPRAAVLHLLKFWRTFVVVLVPLVCLPLLFIDKDDEKIFKCAWVLVIMASYWVTEALPLAITSLIPVALLPTLGIMTTDEVGREYLKETNMMFISGIIVALAIEHCGLHKRIALNCILLIGTSPRKLMLGTMLTTMFLSMWLSNTATTAMMVPIVSAVLQELDKDEIGGGDRGGVASAVSLDTVTVDTDDDDAADGDAARVNDDVESASTSSISYAGDDERTNMRHMIFLSVAYAANTGGTGTLTGTGSNLALKGQLQLMDPDIPVNFANWMLYAVPGMLVCVFICWVWLQLWFLDFGKRPSAICRSWFGKGDSESERAVRGVIKKRLEEIGGMSFHEGSVLFLFVSLVSLWFFRDPGFMTGWGNFVTVTIEKYELVDGNCTSDCQYTKVTEETEAIDDATAGMLVVVLLFVLPAMPGFWPFTSIQESKVSPSLLNWKTIHTNMPWSLVLLLGGGFALAKAIDVSGLSYWIGSKLEVLDFLDPAVLCLIVCAGAAMATEVTSNVATVSILLPILENLSYSLGLNPLYLMIPATLSCSFAFMLPVATPPNAIVYGASGMRTSVMIKCGIWMNLFCVGINFLSINTYGDIIYDVLSLPNWALPSS